MPKSPRDSAVSNSVFRRNKSEAASRSNAIESKHVVRCGPGLNLDEANEIRATLENRYPTGSDIEFVFKLFPLSVGVWILLIRGDDHEEIDTLASNSADLRIDNVLRTVDTLVDRWRAHHKRTSKNADPFEGT